MGEEGGVAPSIKGPSSGGGRTLEVEHAVYFVQRARPAAEGCPICEQDTSAYLSQQQTISMPLAAASLANVGCGP